ncbi:MAG: DUF3164 family protein, partial [Chlorobium sp.]|nr:DUF3164 family protein [Chlorobium sp.]
IQKKIDFGPELQVAQAQLMAAVEEMAPVDTENAAFLKSLVIGSFTLVDGKVRVAEILRLRSYKGGNALCEEAMQIV